MAAADSNAPRTGKLARSAITGLAAARIGMAELSHRTRKRSAQAQAKHEAAMGRILFGALGQLRGSALKVSQLLSMHPGLLPDGVRCELARAHHQAPPLNRALVGRVFRQALGQEPEALFDHFEPTAFAAASLGQVHRAQLAGHGTVAVKVQYPGIAATIASDMQLMRAALREVDYLQEAEQLQWFAQHAAQPGVVMAQPILSHTRAQVLTQQFLPGQHLWDWFMHCIFGLGRVHADPHPGNFLLAPEGTVGVLEFGCTRALPSAFRAQVVQAYQALGLLSKDLSVQAYATELAPALVEMQAWQMEPFTQPVFDFGTKTPPPITPSQHQRVLGRHLAQIPSEMPAFERMWMGLMHLLTQLGARVHTRAHEALALHP